MRRRPLYLRVRVRVVTRLRRPAGDGRWTLPGRPPMLTSMSPATEPTVPESPERDPHAPDVLRLLLDNHARFLAFLERRVGCRDEAEDILQEAFVRSIGRTELLRSPESATAWFYRVLRNALIDHHRREGTRARAFLELAAEVEEGAPDEELEAVACACITALADTLKPEYRMALRRVDLDGLSVRRFAAEAGITPSNAGVRLHRAREALRRQLARSCGTCLTHGCLDCSCGESGSGGKPAGTACS
jgi:RNA polymerase sigma factor (sigma-70 family)